MQRDVKVDPADVVVRGDSSELDADRPPATDAKGAGSGDGSRAREMRMVLNTRIPTDVATNGELYVFADVIAAVSGNTDGIPPPSSKHHRRAFDLPYGAPHGFEGQTNGPRSLNRGGQTCSAGRPGIVKTMPTTVVRPAPSFRRSGVACTPPQSGGAWRVLG